MTTMIKRALDLLRTFRPNAPSPDPVPSMANDTPYGTPVPNASGDGAVGSPGDVAPDAATPAGRDVLVRHDIDLGVIDATGHPLHYAFGHGKLHGQWRVDEDSYVRYIQLRADEEALEAEVERCDAAMAAERDARVEAAALRGQASSKEVEIRHAKAIVGDCEHRLQGVKQRVAAARERLESLHGRGSVFYGLLYGLTGLVFITGDVALARYTVSKALRMNGWEGWAFAVGLALLAIVLKPLYDRLVEDRFHEGHRRTFVGTIIGAAVAVAALLLILGSYRSDFMRLSVQDTDLGDRIEQIDTRIRQQQQAEQYEGIPALEAQRTELEAQRGELRLQIAQNWAGKWTLILSQLLFAVAGAICLGIGIRHWLDWHHIRKPLRQQLGSVKREQHPKRGGTLYRELMNAEEAHAAARADVRRLEEELEAIRAQIGVLESEADALARIEQARQRRDEVFAELRRVRSELFSFLYRTGHAVGQKLPEPKLEAWHEAAAHGGMAASGGSSPKHHPRRRIYLAVREAVRRAAVKPMPGS